VTYAGEGLLKYAGSHVGRLDSYVRGAKAAETTDRPDPNDPVFLNTTNPVFLNTTNTNAVLCEGSSVERFSETFHSLPPIQ
jgi:hypothetical protein